MINQKRLLLIGLQSPQQSARGEPAAEEATQAEVPSSNTNPFLLADGIHKNPFLLADRAKQPTTLAKHEPTRAATQAATTVAKAPPAEMEPRPTVGRRGPLVSALVEACRPFERAV